MKIKSKMCISVQDWDDLVTKTYNRPYTFQQQDGCQERGVFHLSIPNDGTDYENDSVPEEINGDEMGVSFKSWLARDPEEWNGPESKKMFLDLFWARNFYPHIEVLANDLYQKGLIDAGEYMIEIDW